MRTSAARVVLPPTQGYVCLSCRLQSVRLGTGRSRRYNHTNPPPDKEGAVKDFNALSEPSNNGNNASFTPTVKEMINGFMLGDSAKILRKDGDGARDELGSQAGSPQEDSPVVPEPTKAGVQATQRVLQQKFAANRRKQILQTQVDLSSEAAEVVDSKEAATETSSVLTPSKSLSMNVTNRQRRRAQRAKIEKANELTASASKAFQRVQQELDTKQGEKLSAPATVEPLSESQTQGALTDSRLDEPNRNISGKNRSKLQSSSKNKVPVGAVLTNESEQPPKEVGASSKEEGRTPESDTSVSKIMPKKPEPPSQSRKASSKSQKTNTLKELKGSSQSKTPMEKVLSAIPDSILKKLESEYSSPQKPLPKSVDHVPKHGAEGEDSPSKTSGSSQKHSARLIANITANGAKSEQEKDTEVQAKEENTPKRPSESERKAVLAKQLGLKIIRKAGKGSPASAASNEKKADSIPRTITSIARRVMIGKHDAENKFLRFGSQESDVADFESLQDALGRTAAKIRTKIEKADATKLDILPLEVDQPPVPRLSYGLERVLFNPGVYQLQDPRSRVYNFDPYLQKIMPVAEFDFNALKEYITSSRDVSLNRIAKEHGKRYMGSTSSMTGMLSHFHFLLSQWRPINTSMMSKDFPAHLSSFTEVQRTPQAIFLRWKDGSYAIDADKQFANTNVLSMLGKSMEKLLTMSTDDYERYRKSSDGEVTDEESLAPESYHYSTMGDFLMRSQLDAHDPRLPGTGMFDLKTRAVVSIRMEVSNYEQGLGYQIRSRQGEWESYEREFYDMIRAAFLKYSMQVRMGRMDGIFVAYHNIERIFGFQYISLPEMDATIHGQWDTSVGDQEFKLSLDLLNKILDKATKKYPETSLRIHFETRDAATPFMYIFAEPVTEEQVAEIQNQNDTKIQDFERNILGLKRGKESETQDDDGKWANIQASVQEAMDKDELSIDDPSQVLEAQDEDVEGEDVLGHGDVSEESPMYANKDRLVAEEDTNPLTAVGGSSEVEDRDDAEINGVENEEMEEGLVEEEEEEEDDERMEETEEDVEGEEDSVLEEGGESKNLDLAVEEESAVLQDPKDEDEVLDKGALDHKKSLAPVEKDADSQGCEEIDGQGLWEPFGSASVQETASSSAATKKSAMKADKAAYTANLSGEEVPEADFRTEADRPFLDSIHQETSHLDTLASESDVLAMTLTLRNKVNDRFVLRPENLTAEDVWSIEYSLVEVPNQQRAKALYEACQTRRKKKLDAPMIPEDVEVLNHYLKNLRSITARGKEWRQDMDEKDQQRPVHVLGRDTVTGDEEADRSD